MSRKSRAKAEARRQRLRAERQLAAVDTTPSAVPAEPELISKAELRQRLHELIKPGEPILPPPRPTTYEGVRFQHAIFAGIKAGFLEGAAAPSK